MIQQAGSVGIWQILLIAVAVMWLLNAFRRNRILGKIEGEIDRRSRQQNQPQQPAARPGKKHRRLHDAETEDADFEVMD
jgi:hypothetical protein